MPSARTLAERVGFEPTSPFAEATRFPVAPVRPLQHLSFLSLSDAFLKANPLGPSFANLPNSALSISLTRVVLCEKDSPVLG
jgi:hypothetical protein